ncbi:MAG: flagellar biosynthetic protein FliR [Alphaproteobacteria bacterium]|nr:flagellar biosynthetic protein FliR [Alphaproteobacteria bacterium]
MELLQSLPYLSNLSVPTIALVAAIFTRISALSFFLPGLGETVIPVRVRLTVAMAITLILTPAVLPGVEPPLTISATTAMIAAEAIAGALIGFSIRISIFTLQTAGSIASQSLSLSQLFGASIGVQPESPIGTILMITGITLAVATGLHFEAVRVLIISFDVMPLGLFPGASETGQWAAERAAFSFATALSLALPFVVLGFIYNLAIGAANRAMPQLMVAFVGVPAITLAGLIMLAMTAPILLDVWLGIMNDIILTLLGETT